MSEREELGQVWRNFYDRMLALERSRYMYPARWELVADYAEGARRRGEYAASARAYIEPMVMNGSLYPGFLIGLYKTLAAGDMAPQALLVSTLAIEVLEGNIDQKVAATHAALINAEQALLMKAMESEADLAALLRDYSGNPDYRLNRDFRIIAAEWNRITSGLVEHFALKKRGSSQMRV